MKLVLLVLTLFLTPSLQIACTIEDCVVEKIYLAPIQGLRVPSPDGSKYIVNQLDDITKVST